MSIKLLDFGFIFGFIVFGATFNSISFISWRSVVLVEETGEPRENHLRAASHWQTLPHNVVSNTHRYEWYSNYNHDQKNFRIWNYSDYMVYFVFHFINALTKRFKYGCTYCLAVIATGGNQHSSFSVSIGAGIGSTVVVIALLIVGLYIVRRYRLRNEGKQSMAYHIY